MALLKPKVPYWVFPCGCWSPYFFVVFGDLAWSQKKWHFPKTDSVNENAQFFFWTQIVFAYFSKNCHFRRNIVLFATTKKHYFQFFSYFPCFSSFLLFFLQHKKRQKQKMHFFFRKPFFDTPTTCPKFIFAPLHTICDLKNNAPNTTKFGKTSKVLDLFLTQAWTNFWLKERQHWTNLWRYIVG